MSVDGNKDGISVHEVATDKTQAAAVSVDKFYEEGCNFMRHYSTCSLNVRLMALVQGVILLSGCAYILAVVHNPFFLTLVSLFGILMTALTLSLHVSYFQAADVFVAELVKLEEKLPAGKQNGIVTPYDQAHQARYASFWTRLVTIHATFTLIGFAFLVFFLWGILRK
jgi:hypothetical protein